MDIKDGDTTNLRKITDADAAVEAVIAAVKERRAQKRPKALRVDQRLRDTGRSVSVPTFPGSPLAQGSPPNLVSGSNSALRGTCPSGSKGLLPLQKIEEILKGAIEAPILKGSSSGPDSGGGNVPSCCKREYSIMEEVKTEDTKKSPFRASNLLIVLGIVFLACISVKVVAVVAFVFAMQDYFKIDSIGNQNSGGGEHVQPPSSAAEGYCNSPTIESSELGIGYEQ
jgi:hypothetical protein